MQHILALQRIREHLTECHPGQRIESERKLAKRWGLSYSAVNRAMKELMAQRVLLRTGYQTVVADQRGPQAPVHVSKRVLAVVPDDERWVEAARPLILKWSAGGMVVRLVAMKEEKMQQQALMNELHENITDGVVVFTCHEKFDNPGLTYYLRERKIAFVVANMTLPGEDSVMLDYRGIIAESLFHLRAAGHSKIGFLIEDQPFPWIAACAGFFHEFAGPQAGSPVCKAGGGSDRRLHASIDHVLKTHAQVTAWLCLTLRLARLLVRRLELAGYRVPADRAVAALFVDESPHADHRRITALPDDNPHIINTAFHLLATRMDQGGQAPPCHLLLKLSLLKKGSCEVNKPPETVTPAVPSRWPQDVQRRRAVVQAMNAAPFPQYAGLPPHVFQNYPLGPWLTRGVAHHRGWMGTGQLRHLPPGQLMAHGIPFAIGAIRKEAGAIMLRSAKVHRSSRGTLPTEVSIPIGARSPALFLLVACGHTSSRQPFGELVMEYEDKTNARWPLVPLGSTDTPIAGNSWKPNLQNQLPSYPQQELHHSLPWVLTCENDPLIYERWLYVICLQNKCPKKQIARLVISTDSTREDTLAVLGISVLHSAGDRGGDGVPPNI